VQVVPLQASLQIAVTFGKECFPSQQLAFIPCGTSHVATTHWHLRYCCFTISLPFIYSISYITLHVLFISFISAAQHYQLETTLQSWVLELIEVILALPNSVVYTSTQWKAV
jgi:hypothetical protein